jgi:hypothetical protein
LSEREREIISLRLKTAYDIVKPSNGLPFDRIRNKKEGFL